MNYTEKQTTEVKDGFRIAWFIPVEMFLSGAMLGLAPKLGLGVSITLVGIPAVIMLVKIALLQNRLAERYTEPDWRVMKTLTPQEYLAYWDGDDFDFTKPNWYSERVMKEMWEILNPFTPIRKIAHKISKTKLPKMSWHSPKKAFLSSEQ